MSKTSQRKLSHIQNSLDMYKQGFKDATKNNGWFRWYRHPYINQYRLGFKAGIKELDKNIKPSFWKRIYNKIKGIIK